MLADHSVALPTMMRARAVLKGWAMAVPLLPWGQREWREWGDELPLPLPPLPIAAEARAVLLVWYRVASTQTEGQLLRLVTGRRGGRSAKDSMCQNHKLSRL